MNYKVQFKSYDPVANATKVSVKQDYPYRVFEESLPNNRMGDEETTLVEAVSKSCTNGVGPLWRYRSPQERA